MIDLIVIWVAMAWIGVKLCQAASRGDKEVQHVSKQPMARDDHARDD